MKSIPLSILIFDGSFKTTAFINRLAAGLAERHSIYIAGFNEIMVAPVPNVRYIALGSNDDKIRFVKTALYWAWKKKSFKILSKTFKALLRGERKNIQRMNLRAALAYIKPDIIHLQWTSVISIYEEVLKEEKIPVIFSQRGFHTNVKPFVYKQNMEYLRRWYPYFAGFHSVSHAVSQKGDNIWNAVNKLEKVVYTGLPIGEWLFNTNFKRTSSIQLLSVGRAHWIKGYDYGLRVCSILKAKNISFHYTIIGGAGEEELQFLVNDLGLQEHVLLLGRRPLEEVKTIMRDSSLMIIPSLEEGLPNVAVEAMAIGLPVVAFDAGGVPELIENGKEGWLVPVRDVEAMAEAIIDFRILNDEELEEVRVAARKKVERQHTEQQMINDMEMLYVEVLEKWNQEIN